MEVTELDSQEAPKVGWEGSWSSSESWLNLPSSEPRSSSSPVETGFETAEPHVGLQRFLDSGIPFKEAKTRTLSKWSSQPWTKLGARRKRKNKRRRSLIGSAPPGMSWAVDEQEARSQMLEFCQSDTDLLELDPFASIHHINDVIRRCHEDEALGGSSGSPVHEAIEDTIFHSAPEVSIFDQWVMSQKYGAYGEWKDSDSCVSHQTANNSLPTPSFEFGSRARSAASTSDSEQDEEGDLHGITGFMDRADLQDPAEASGSGSEEGHNNANPLWTADADSLTGFADPSKHTTLMSGESIESLRRAAAALHTSPFRPGSEGLDDSDLETPPLCTPSPSPLKLAEETSSSQPSPDEATEFQQKAADTQLSSPDQDSRQAATSIRPAEQNWKDRPDLRVSMAETLASRDVQRRPSLISLSEADFLNSEHDRSSVESRPGVVSLSYMMSVWDRDSNENEACSSYAVSEACSIGGQYDADPDHFAFEVDPQAVHLRHRSSLCTGQGLGGTSTGPGIVLTPQGSEDNKDLPNPPGPEPSEIQPTEKSSRTKSLKAEYDNPKDTVVRPRSAPAAGTSATLGGAFSKLRSIITKALSSTSKSAGASPSAEPSNQSQDIGRSIGASSSKSRREAHSQSRKASIARPPKIYGTIDTSEIEEEADIVPEPVEKPQSHASQPKEDPDSRTSSSKSQIESSEDRRRRRRQRRRAQRALADQRPLASIRRVPVSAILRSADSLSDARQKSRDLAAAEPPRQPRALLSGSSASDSRRQSDQSLGSASLESQKIRSSAKAVPLTKPSHREVTYRRKAEPNRWETALQEISEISPDPATAVADPSAGAMERVSSEGEGGRPVRSQNFSEIQPLPEEDSKLQPRAPWGREGQTLQSSQLTEKQFPPKQRSGMLAESFTPPQRQPAKISTQKGQSRKAVREQKAGSSQGRAMSFLLTTMPEITDIGFRGGINFVKKLSRRSLAERPRLRAESVTRQVTTPAAVAEARMQKQPKQPEPPQEGILRKEKPKKESSRASAEAQEAASLQALLDKGPLKRSPLSDKRLPARSNTDWLYATMPSVSPQRSPANLHVLKTSPSKSGLRTAEATIPPPLQRGELNLDKTQVAQSLQPVTQELSLGQQASHGSQLRGLLSLPESSQPVQVLSETPAQAEEAKPQPLSAPHGGHSQQPKPERRHLVQRALFKSIDPEIQPAPEPSLAPVKEGLTESRQQASGHHAKQSSSSPQVKDLSTAGTAGSAENNGAGVVLPGHSLGLLGNIAGEASVHPLVQHISPRKLARKWRSYSLEYESKLEKHGGRRYHSLPEEAAQSYLHSLGEEATAREKLPPKPEALPQTAGLPEASAASKAEKIHPALALQPAGIVGPDVAAGLPPAPQQASKVEVTFEAAPSVGPEMRSQLQDQQFEPASSSRSGVTFETRASSGSSGQERHKVSPRPGWPFSPPEPRSRLGVEFLEAGKYEGQIQGSRIEGLGVLTKEGGGSYAGKWEHAAFQGAGIEDFSEDHDLVEYLGHFHQGQRHGTGICRYADGSIYVGPWHQGSQHGLGRMESKTPGDPEAYVGTFRCDSRHGLGVASYKNGEEYAGEFNGGVVEGYGVASLGGTSGTYEGEWRNGTRHGWAVSTLANKTMWAGQWHGGRPCWLAQFKAPLPGELADDSAEAMDMCDEVARRARAISRKAIAQAEAFSHPEGRIQAAIQQAVADARKEAREACREQQKAEILMQG